MRKRPKWVLHEEASVRNRERGALCPVCKHRQVGQRFMTSSLDAVTRVNPMGIFLVCEVCYLRERIPDAKDRLSRLAAEIPSSEARLAELTMAKRAEGWVGLHGPEMATLGEHGPETIVMDEGGWIIPNKPDEEPG